MTKEQINYLLVLATLAVVWLYFNTFYVNPPKFRAGSPVRSLAAAPSTARRMPNFQAIPNAPVPPKIAELMAKLPKDTQVPAAPKKIQVPSPEALQPRKTANS